MSLINDDTYGNSDIRLKTLEKEYEVLLKQYVEAKKNYLEALEGDAKEGNKYVIRDNTGIRGHGDRVILDVASVEDCKALCIENKCTAAEYITEFNHPAERNFKSLCRLYNGFGSVSDKHERPGSVLIIRRFQEALQIMGDVIRKLLDVNYQMLQEAENVDPTYQQDIDAKKIRAGELFASYKGLINERDIVNQKMDEYSMLSQKYSDENINAGRQYGLVSIWGFIVFLIFVFALREIFQINISFFPIFIGAIVFFLGLNLGVPAGFLVWLGVIVLLLFLYFMNVDINIG